MSHWLRVYAADVAIVRFATRIRDACERRSMQEQESYQAGAPEQLQNRRVHHLDLSDRFGTAGQIAVSALALVQIESAEGVRPATTKDR